MEKGNHSDSDDPGALPGQPGDGPRYQPPSLADLRRHPPRSGKCAYVRAMLRDYADEDLAPAERELVDEHGHECRDCAVALSRAEAEAYGLQQALSTEPVPVAVDFSARVMAQVRSEHVAALAEDGSAVSADFTPRVMERIRREWKRPSLRARVVGLAQRHTLSLLALAAAAILLVWWRAGGGSELSPMQVVRAEGANLQRGARAMTLVAGDVLQAGDGVRLLHAGRATLLVPGSDGSDRAVLDLDGDAQIEVRPRLATARSPAFRLVGGHLALRVTDEDGLSLALSDACRIDLEPGEFSVFAEPVERHDGRLAVENAFTGVRLVALRGRAYIARGHGARVQVQPGFAALFDEWSRVEFERCLSDSDLASTLARRDVAKSDPAPVPVPAKSDWLGRVINGRTNAGVASASVTFRRSGQGSVTVTTGDDGSFRLEGLGDVDGEIAFVEVALPEGSPATQFGNVANFADAITLRDVSKGTQRDRRLNPIRLPAERLVMGTVFDAQRRPVAGAQITPVAIDSIAGSARRLSPLIADVVSDGNGRFTLRRLPASLPPYMDVVLLVEHAQHGAVAALDLLSEPSIRDQAIEVALARRDRVSITDLPPAQSVEILASIRNLAPTAMLQVTPAVTSPLGTIEIDVSEGALLWLRQGAALVALAARKGQPLAFQRSEAKIPPQVAALAAQRRGRGSAVVERGRWRYDAVLAAGGEPRVVALMDRDGHELAGARLFVLGKNDGSAAYVGEMTSSSALLPMPPGSDYRVVAVTDDGAVGVADANELQENMLRVRVLSPGSALLPAEVINEMGLTGDQRGGIVMFELQMTEPLRDYVVHRHAGRDSGWELRALIPGTYRLTNVDGRSWQVRVPPGGRGEFTVRAGG